MTFDFERALPIAAALFLVRLLTTEALGRRARFGVHGLRFPLTAGMRLTIRAGCPLMLFASYKILQQAASRQDLILAMIVALLATSGLLFEPGEIATNETDIVQRSLLGLRTRKVPWTGAGVLYGPGARELIISGADGVSITHTQYHAGREDLISELLKHDIYVPGVSNRFF